MYLKTLKIVNWQCIEYTKAVFENLMLFIGPTNNGKSSIIAAIMFFLGYRNLRMKDIKNQNVPLELEGSFSNFSKRNLKDFKEYICDKELKLRIVKYPDRDIQYKVQVNGEWKVIVEEEYRQLMSALSILYIPPFPEHEQAEFFINSLLGILKRRNIDEKRMIEALKSLAETLSADYVSKGLYRNLLFEVFRAITAASRKEEQCILGNTMILFEEPELYLHPQAEKELYDCFITLSKMGVL